MLSPGEQITASLRLIRRLSAGGMGTVWIAHHAGLDGPVVVKFVSAELATDPVALNRFRNEAAAASKVRSPHVVQILDHGLTQQGLPYIAMELLEGEDLASRLAAIACMPLRQVVTFVQHVARALARAHERGVVHRDIKPANIFLADIGSGEAFVKVVDFGIAKSEIPSALEMTKTGAMIGTPFYMSPEQVLGSREIGASSDLWALGVVAFEAMTGRCPFEGETVGALAIAICHGDVPLPSHVRREIRPAVDAWFVRACARDPAQRFRSAQEMAAALERAVGGAAPIPTDVDDAPTLMRESPNLQSLWDGEEAESTQHMPSPPTALAVTPFEHHGRARMVAATGGTSRTRAAALLVGAAFAGVLAAAAVVRLTPSPKPAATEETQEPTPAKPRPNFVKPVVIAAPPIEPTPAPAKTFSTAQPVALPSVSAIATASSSAVAIPTASAMTNVKSPWSGDDWPEGQPAKTAASAPKKKVDDPGF